MKIYIAMGSNVGKRRQHLIHAIEAMEKIREFHYPRISQIYETSPVGGPAKQGKYLNAVLEIETLLTPQEVLKHLLAIEKKLGRKRSVKNAPRTIDLDLLLYEGKVIEEPGLTLPHPRLHERLFVLKPLCDLAPELIHPILKKKLKELLKSIGQSA